ncbi:MAG: hypothetical protein KZQ66_18865 [Candidatus Thiodiazotropha sp. (ex Lucinoma aequizonata)]|nr:hypothetical protein [Candidatus Thiodiazotropha sp. (ex Lucinoma aequizonata)]MCU7899032.1 hypothetical protein [Candidatus Thiodiazotropha sp. (ex Lucinoma aequizonata)]MCU7903781.1 hypothetical protein [Candidatus Thiodiazotropha sp. (ex Lucinoma aequizonata)]
MSLWKNTASLLKDSDRWQFIGNKVNLIGHGGQRFAEEVLGWNRVTIRKGQTELRSGTTFESYIQCTG